MIHGHIQPEYGKRLSHRLKIAQGQLRGLEKMITEHAYCVDIFYQSLAIQESLKSFDGLIFENHLKTHIADQFKNGEEAKALQELLKIYKLKRK
ncbi:MAG: metal-sensing transcriptional repressor [bacterium]|nr:metal-sensing transcriptional repressor [bacterium]